MCRFVFAAIFLAGCQTTPLSPLSDLAGQDAVPTVIVDAAVDMTTAAEHIRYSVVAPFNLNGTSTVGPDADVFSDVPKLGGDPYALLFSYKGLAFSLQSDLTSSCCNEDVPISYAQLTMSGSQNCSSWRGTYMIYSPTATERWHLSIDAQCSTNLSLYLKGDWRFSR